MLLFSLPSFRADNHTLSSFVREIGENYEAVLRGETPGDAPMQYADLSEWQNQPLETEDMQLVERYWREQTPDDDVSVSLPFEDQLETAQEFNPETLPLALGQGLMSETEALCKKYAVSPSTFFLGCWNVLIWQLTSNLNPLVGVVSDGRSYEELESVLGPFARSLPVRAQLYEGLTFAGLLKQIEKITSDACKWQDHFRWESFFKSQNKNSDSFFFPLSFEFVSEPVSYSAEKISLSLHTQYCCIDRFKLKLHCGLSGGKLFAELHYDAGRIRQNLEPLARQMTALMQSCLANPEAPIGELNGLGDADRELLVIRFNENARSYPENESVSSLFEQQVNRAPDNSAVEFGEEQLTYAELNARANKLARYLRSLGVGPEVPVAICLDRSPELLIGILGILKAGGAYLPLDLAYPQERLAFMLEDSRTKFLITQNHLVKNLPCESLAVVCMDNDWEQIERFASSNLECFASPDNLTYIIYTSGSTGKPKGTMIPNRGLVNYLRWCADAYHVADGEGAPVHSPIGFDLTVTSLFSPLLVGKRVILLAETTGIESLYSILTSRKNLSLVKITPAHIKALSNLLQGEDLSDCTKTVVVGGDALQSEDVAFWRLQSSEIKIVNEYGPTETVVGCCAYEVPTGASFSGAVPIGRPIANTQIYLLDRNFKPVSTWIPGEIYIGGHGIARGYLNSSDLTAEMFIPNPFSDEPGARLYRTGDIARFLPDPHIEFIGRGDNQVKIRGYRIELEEIKSALGKHPAVSQAAVIARQGTTGDKQLAAYLVPDLSGTGGARPTVGELRGFLERELPEYMIPAMFIFLEALPLTSNGKIDYKALPATDEASVERSAAFVAPRTLEEELLAGVWSQVLGVNRIGIDDGYFALGGDSIRSIQLVSLAREKGLFFTIEDLFTCKTIRALAAMLSTANKDEWQPLKTEPFSLISKEDKQRLPEYIEDAYPLSMLQAGMIYHREYSPESAIYHDVSSFHLKAYLDLEMLRKAVEIVENRHPALRTTFDMANFSEPLQLVHRKGVIPLEIEDLHHLSEEQQATAILEWIEAEKKRDFDWTKLPLVRFQIHLRAQNSFQFTLSFHHAVLDGWSDATMLTELFHEYFYLVNGLPSTIEAPATSYRDFVALEKEALGSEEIRRYWMEKMSDLQVAELPRWPNAKLESRDKRAIGWIPVPISEDVSDGLQRLAQSVGVPLKSVLLAAHFKVMRVLSGQSDLVTCLSSSGRPETIDGDRVLGLFLNSMPLRVDVSDGTWLDLIKTTFEAERESLPYRRFPMAETKRALGGITPSETTFYFTHYHIYQSLRGLLDYEVVGHTVYEETSFTLVANFGLNTFTSRVYLNLSYDITQLCEQQANEIAGYYFEVLSSMVSDPGALHAYVSVLSDKESDYLLSERSDARSNYLSTKCLHQSFEEQVERMPDQIAVVHEDEQLTYGELNSRANKLARYLKAAGFGPNTVMGILFERSIDMVITMVGVLKAGGTYLPLDPSSPEERLAFMLEDAQSQVLITSHDLAQSITSFRGFVLSLDSNREEVARHEDENITGETNPDALLAYIIYTSGSTGKPKGVAVTHHNAMRLFEATQGWFDFNEKDVWTQFHSFAFDFSVWELWGPLLHGGRLVIVPYFVSRSPESFYQLLGEQQVTVLNQTPSAFRQLIDVEEFANHEDQLSLRLVIFGGEALEIQSLRPWFERHGDDKPRLVNMYGITETTVHVSYRPISLSDLEQARGSVIGGPIPDLQVYILDQYQQPVPIGVAGEIYIGGGGVALGYLNRAALTAERFVPDQFNRSAGGRLYRSGDLGRFISRDEIEYLGRTDHQIKIRGFRIELGEIESAINSHPAVADSVVLAREDAPGEKRLVAYIVAGSEEAVSISEIREYLRESLPEYMVPSAFVRLEQMPLTANGKLDRRALERMEASSREDELEFVAPRTDEEEVMSRIWEEVLGIERVGVHDEFSDLGGHSILAVQLISKVREGFRVDLPLKKLYEYPTVAELVEEVARQKWRGATYEELPKIEKREDERFEPFEMRDVQEAYWIGRREAFELGNIGSHLYTEIEMEGLDVARMNLALQKLIDRHEMLRAVALADGRQRILAEVPKYEIEVMDLREKPQDEIEREMLSLRELLSHRVITGDQWPLFHIRAALIPNDRARMFISLDALVADAWTRRILARELFQMYKNSEIVLPALDLSFRDYILAEKKLRKTELYERSKRYWMERLKTLPPAPELPLAMNPETLKHPKFKGWSGRFDPETWSKLKKRAARAGLTPTGVMMAAFSEILGYWSKSDRLTLNLTLYNRLPLHEQVNQIMGDFTSLTMLAIDCPEDATFEQKAKMIQERLWDDLDHRYFSGVELVRELARIKKDLTGVTMPVVFTSILNLRNLYRYDEEEPDKVELIYGITQTPQIWLDHQVMEEEGFLIIKWDAVDELFPEGMLDDMFTAYCSFIQGLATQDLLWRQTSRDFLPDSQRAVLRASNSTHAPLSDHLLHSLFAKQALAHPLNLALISSSASLSYGQLYFLASNLARSLRASGAKPNHLIAVLMHKGFEQVVAVLAILQSGAAYLPIDADLPQHRIDYLLDNGEVNIVLTQNHLMQSLNWKKDLEVIQVQAHLSSEPDYSQLQILDTLQKPEDLAYVIYTSGSTGQPKGVMIEHRAAVNTILDVNERYNIGPQDRVLALSSLSFDLSVYDIFGLLAAGGALVIPEADTQKDPGKWAQLITQHKVSVWNSVPALMDLMNDTLKETGSVLSETLRVVMLSGDWIPVRLAKEISQHRQDIKLVSMGGATECAIWSVLEEIKHVDEASVSIPYGLPMQNQRMRISSLRGEEKPDWVIGEIRIAGEGLARGYWRDEQKSRERFVQQAGEREYRTGDLGRRMPDGRIEIIGREDNQVKVQGYRIELGEIEAALKQEAGVKAAVVTAIGEREGSKRLIGYVVMDGEEGAEREIKEKVRKKVPEYMVPSVIVRMERMPLTANGKIDRNALPHPEEIRFDSGGGYVKPSTPLEETLAGMLAEVLSVEQVGIYDDFFDLGGDSIQAIRLVNLVQKTLEIDIPLVRLLRGATVADLVIAIEEILIAQLEGLSEEEAKSFLER